MITRDDLNDALHDWMADERDRLGGPPSPEEIEKYLRGALPPDEAARVRALLVYDPGLTPILTERVGKSRKTKVLALYAAGATAAMLALGVDTLQQRRRGAEPAVLTAHHEFNPLLTRGTGGGGYVVAAGQQRYLLTLIPTRPPSEAAYSIEIAQGSRVVWRAENVCPVGDTFILDIPGQFLEPGAYALNVRAEERLVERYPFEVRR